QLDASALIAFLKRGQRPADVGALRQAARDLGQRQRRGGGEQQGLDPAFDLEVVGGEVESHGVSSSGCPSPLRFSQTASNGRSCRMSMPPSFTSSRLADRVEAV